MANSVIRRASGAFVVATAGASLALLFTVPATLPASSDPGDSDGAWCVKGIEQTAYVGAQDTLLRRLSWALQTPACDAVDGGGA